ncbi:MAG TPA: type I restriction endonuclease subunit M [Burkholderiaceae bacterium]|nr:type I restriction endonuclease subunit M [Burkholderiaceae bacterium]
MTNNDTTTDEARSQTPVTIIVGNGLLFFPGQVVATPDSIALMQLHQFSAAALLNRHLHGDFGDVHPDDLELNKNALVDGSRILSCFRLSSPEKIMATPRSKRHLLPTVWVISDAVEGDPRQREVTTFLTPENY